MNIDSTNLTVDQATNDSTFKAHWDRPPLSVDFDGVIHKYRKGWITPEIYDPPMEGAHWALTKLLKTHAVHILTARCAQDVLAWCLVQFPDLKFEIIPDSETYWQVEGIIGITNKKRAAIAYIDDRGIRFTNWRDIINYFQ